MGRVAVTWRWYNTDLGAAPLVDALICALAIFVAVLPVLAALGFVPTSLTTATMFVAEV